MHVNDLLRLNGPSFVEAAYSTLLKRQVDRTGLDHFMDRLAAGDSKEAIIVALATSTEAKGSRIDLIGLRTLIKLRSKSPWRRIVRFFSELRTIRRQLARIEHMLGEQSRLPFDAAAYRGWPARGYPHEQRQESGLILSTPLEKKLTSDNLQNALFSIQENLSNTAHDADMFVHKMKHTIRSSTLFFTMD